MIKLLIPDNALPKLCCRFHNGFGLLLHAFELSCNVFNGGFPFCNLLRHRRWLYQGLEHQVIIMKLNNSFPQSFRVFDWGEVGRVLKNVLAGFRNNLHYSAAVGTHLHLFKDQAVLQIF